MDKIEAKEWTISHGDYIRTADDLSGMHEWVLRRQKIINMVAIVIAVPAVFLLIYLFLIFISRST